MFLSAILNHFRLYKLNIVDKFVMSYGGLRGAVAFALALLINPHHVKRRKMFITTTIAVIYFTVFIQVRMIGFAVEISINSITFFFLN